MLLQVYIRINKACDGGSTYISVQIARGMASITSRAFMRPISINSWSEKRIERALETHWGCQMDDPYDDPLNCWQIKLEVECMNSLFLTAQYIYCIIFQLFTAHLLHFDSFIAAEVDEIMMMQFFAITYMALPYYGNEDMIIDNVDISMHTMTSHWLPTRHSPVVVVVIAVIE